MKKNIGIIVALAILVLTVLGFSYFVNGEPTVFVNYVTIDKPREKIFHYLADMRNEPKWNPDAMYMRMVTNGPIRQGTIFRAKYHSRDTIDVVINKFSPPDDLTFENGGNLGFTLHFILRPRDGKAEIEARFIVRPKGFTRALFPLFRSGLEEQQKINVTVLKKAIDQW